MKSPDSQRQKKSDKISKSVSRTFTKCVKDFLLNQGLPIPKKFIHNFLSRHNLADKQTDRQTNKEEHIHNLLGRGNHNKLLQRAEKKHLTIQLFIAFSKTNRSKTYKRSHPNLP